jgi:hypothetical protein
MALLIVGLVVAGYFWLKERQARAEGTEIAKAFLADEIAQKKWI